MEKKQLILSSLKINLTQFKDTVAENLKTELSIKRGKEGNVGNGEGGGSITDLNYTPPDVQNLSHNPLPQPHVAVQ